MAKNKEGDKKGGWDLAHERGANAPVQRPPQRVLCAIKWIRTSSVSITYSLSLSLVCTWCLDVPTDFIAHSGGGRGARREGGDLAHERGFNASVQRPPQRDR